MDACLQRALVSGDDQVWTWDERTQIVSIRFDSRDTTATTEPSDVVRYVVFPRGEETSAWCLLGHHLGQAEGQESLHKSKRPRTTIVLETLACSEADDAWEALLPPPPSDDRQANNAVPLLPITAHGVLMSCLQKAIRLRETACALRLVYTIAAQPTSVLMVELLRRLPIILIEDAVAHPLLSSLVFLMLLASPSRDSQNTFTSLTRAQLCLVLRVVQDVCGPRVPAERRCLSYDWYTLPLIPDAETQGDACAQATLLALAVRGAFGGMRGDIEMLGKALVCWRERFQVSARDASPLPSYWIEWTTHVKPGVSVVPHWSLQGLDTKQEASWWFTARDQLLTAVDYHCSNLLDRVPRTFSDTPIPVSAIGELEQLVWHRRSGVYRRICCCKPRAQRHVFPAVDEARDPTWWVRLNATGFLDRFCAQTWQYRMRPQIAAPAAAAAAAAAKPKLSRKRILEQATDKLTRADAAAAAPPAKQLRSKPAVDFFGRPLG
jgi:hypothetical protein